VHTVFTLHWSLRKRESPSTVVRHLGEEMTALGHEVTYLSFDDVPLLHPTYYSKLVFPEFLALRLRRLERQRRIDVIDSSSGDSWLWARLNRRRPPAERPALVVRSHGLELHQHRARMQDVDLGTRRVRPTYHFYTGGLRLWQEAASFRAADTCVFLSEFEREAAIEDFGLDPDAAEVVPHGLPDFMLGLPVRPDNGRIRIAQVAIYMEHKGIRYGAEALKGVLGRHPGVSVTFLGTKRDREVVLRDFDPELHDRIEVVPEFDKRDLPALLADHHISMLPSVMEGFSLGLLESMACGLAPVASEIPAIASLVADGESGLLVPPRDSGALEAALERLVVDATLRARLREAARESAQEFSWRHVTELMLDVYERARVRRDAAARGG
jgi:glycosyltransferase involved in cell wall biosynthesis